MTIEMITKTSEAKALLKDLLRRKSVNVDTETEGFDRLRQKMCLLQLGDYKQQNLIDLSKVDVQLFKPLFEREDIEKVAHNGLFDFTWLKHEHDIVTRNIYDTMNGEKVMLGVVLPFKPPTGWTKAKLDALKPLYSAALEWCLHRRKLPSKFEFEPFIYGKPLTENQALYSARDIEHLEALKEDQLRNISLLNLDNVIELENRVLEVFYMMSATGFNIDVKGWKQYAIENEGTYGKAIAGLTKHAKINWQAPGQTCKFFGVKIIAELEKLVPKGKKQTEAFELWKDARRTTKWVSTYGNKWLTDNVYKGKVYCNFTQIINTGRCSSDSPNLQNLPVKNGAKHRSFFVPGKGNVFCIGDFSGQELAIMAIGSQEPIWLETLRAGKDLHSKAGELMSQVAKKEIPRRMAKTLNFTMGYGGGWMTVQTRLKQDYDIEISEAEAKQLVYAYFSAFPKVKRYLNSNGELGVKFGKTYSYEPFNRLRVLALEDEDWRKKNIGKNSPIQGTAADMTKLAMIYMKQKLEGTSGFIVHQLHDELVVECKKKDQKKVKQLMIDAMNEACTVILGEPLSAPDVHIKDNWGK